MNSFTIIYIDVHIHIDTLFIKVIGGTTKHSESLGRKRAEADVFALAGIITWTGSHMRVI